MPISTLAPAVTLPVLSDAERTTQTDVLRNMHGMSATSGAGTYWRNHRTETALWSGASRDPELVNLTPQALISDNWPNTAHVVDIWNEAHNDHAMRERALLEMIDNPVDWATATDSQDAEIERELLAQFDGPIPDPKLAKLREIVKSERAAQRELEGARQLIARQEELLSAEIDASDSRVRHLFARAAVAADQEGYCSTYENIAEKAGLPARGDFTGQEINEAEAFFRRGYDVTVRFEVETVITVEATSARDANEEVRLMSARERWEYNEPDENSVYDWDITDTRESD